MDCLTNLLDWQIGHAGRQAATALHRCRVCFGECLAIDPTVLERFRSMAGATITVARTTVTTIVDIRDPLIRIVILTVPVAEPEIRSRRENACENEIGTEGPKRIVVSIRPERE